MIFVVNINGFFDFWVEFLGCQKWQKNFAILHCYKMADAKHLLRYSLKYRRKKIVLGCMF